MSGNSDDSIRHFIVIEDLFERYTVVMEPVAATTSVYCDSCEQWVAEFRSDQLSTQSTQSFYEKILEEHESDFPDHVSFETGPSESFM